MHALDNSSIKLHGGDVYKIGLVIFPLASSPGTYPLPRREAWYTLFAHARNILSSVIYIVSVEKITNTYHTLSTYMNCTLSTYTNRTCSFYASEQKCCSKVAASPVKPLFGRALLCATSVVKASHVQDGAGTSCVRREMVKSICYLSVGV